MKVLLPANSCIDGPAASLTFRPDLVAQPHPGSIGLSTLRTMSVITRGRFGVLRRREWRISNHGVAQHLGQRTHFIRVEESDWEFSITADVHFIGKGPEDHRKAVVVVRQSLEPKAAYCDVALHGTA